MGSSASRPNSRRPSRVGSLSSLPSPSTKSDGSPKKDKDSKNEQRRNQENDTAETSEGKDIMISYSHGDKDMMQKVKSALEENGFSVWVDIVGLTAGVNFLSKIGQAIIDSKALVSLLSEKTIKSRCCQDELALAYVSQKPIFPIGLQTPQELLPLMGTGMRLQLARFDWFILTNPATFDDNLKDFIIQLRDQFHSLGYCHTCSHEKELPSKKEKPKRKLRRSASKSTNTLVSVSASEFWKQNFDKKDLVEWETFVKVFHDVFDATLKEKFQIDDTKWIEEIVKRELEVKHNNRNVSKENYVAFCTVDGEELAFISIVEDHAVESYCMKEVFNMESSVRVEAIENLGRFKSKTVIEALMDLLDDSDNNVVTVAAISLAKTGDNSARVKMRLMQCLESDDRLVRESGSLALGLLKAEEAVPKLVHLWRNDFISSVRDACQLALEQIGGDEANQAIHITNVLAKEIRSLTT